MTSPLRAALRPALRGLSKNRIPGLVLQVFALLIVVAYYHFNVFASALDQIGQVKSDWGYGYSMSSTALFGGLIPFLVLWAAGRIPPNHLHFQGLFYLCFWAWKGAEIDAFYSLQASIFGNQTSLSVIATKTFVDQFVYNPLWAAPSQTLFFLWKDSGFSVSEMRRRLKQRGLLPRILVVLLSTWMVWLPAVAIIYSLPSALQLPLFNLVLCFWCLLLSFLSRQSR